MTIFNQHKWLLHAAGVALGIGIGFFVGSQNATSSDNLSVDQSAKSSSSRSATSTLVTEAETRKSAQLKQLRDKAMSDDYKLREEFLKTIQASDVPDLLAVFLEEAGLDGLGYQQREILERAVALWIAEDEAAALLWADNLAQPKLRRYLQNVMLTEVAKTDPFRAVALAKDIEALDKEFRTSSVAMTGISSLMKMPGKEKEIAELMRLTASDDSGSGGVGQTFPEGFAFETLLNSMAEMKREGIKPEMAPTGMLEAWSKLDAEAAHAWWLANGDLVFEDWGDVLNGVVDTVGHEKSSQWYVEKFSQADQEQRETMARSLRSVYEAPAARMVAAESIAKQMQPDDATEFVEHVIQDHFSINNNDQADGLLLLNWYPTPSARADVIMKNHYYRDADSIFKMIPEANLAPYGVTRQELEAASQRRKAERSRRN